MGRDRFVMGRISRHAVGSLVHRPQTLPLEAIAHPFVADPKTLLAQPSHDPRPTVAALAARVKRRHLRIQCRIGRRAITGRAHSPLAIPRARHPELAAHARHAELVALFFDPGVLHRDSFAKYAAVFFTISRSSLVLLSSRRNRAFSASSSVTERFTVTAAPSAALSLPARLSLIQFHRLDSGMPNRLAA